MWDCGVVGCVVVSFCVLGCGVEGYWALMLESLHPPGVPPPPPPRGRPGDGPLVGTHCEGVIYKH